jgi:hypothetical protein
MVVVLPWLRASQPSGFRLAWLAAWAWIYFAVSAKALATAVAVPATPQGAPTVAAVASACSCVARPEKASIAFPALMQGFGVEQQEAGAVRGGGAGNPHTFARAHCRSTSAGLQDSTGRKDCSRVSRQRGSSIPLPCAGGVLRAPISNGVVCDAHACTGLTAQAARGNFLSKEYDTATGRGAAVTARDLELNSRGMVVTPRARPEERA